MVDNLKAKAEYKRARISPKKMAPVMDLVRGKRLKEAKKILTFDRTKASKMLLKLINSAEANAKNTQKTDADLFISELWVGMGPTWKVPYFRGRGRFNLLTKRTSNIFVGLSEENSAEKVSKEK